MQSDQSVTEKQRPVTSQDPSCDDQITVHTVINSDMDLTKLGTVVQHNFPLVWSCGEDFHDGCLDALSALGMDRFGPGVLGS